MPGTDHKNVLVQEQFKFSTTSFKLITYWIVLVRTRVFSWGKTGFILTGDSQLAASGLMELLKATLCNCLRRISAEGYTTVTAAHSELKIVKEFPQVAHARGRAEFQHKDRPAYFTFTSFHLTDYNYMRCANKSDWQFLFTFVRNEVKT